MTALGDALRAEITKRDAVYENLQILDELIHQLLEITAPLHTEEEDCDCIKHGQPGHKHEDNKP